MMILDVVYNHFGPEGNFLGRYAPQFFTDRFHTPWGSAIDFGRREVRDFFIHNALYWLEEYRFDGLRLDAVHAIADDSTPGILEELARAVHDRFEGERHVHLVLENDDNAAHYLRRDARGGSELYVAQWNDDIHHAFHVLATSEVAGYYRDYCDDPIRHLGRCLTEGFAYQGEPSAHREGEPRGEASVDLPLTAFVSFLQNHDQIGNRAMGERLSMMCRPEALRLLTAVMLLAPSPPLLFMGEEWSANTPFLFFCDFHDALADAVREGRRGEFRHFPQFRDEAARERIPDPNAAETFRRSKLDWRERERPAHREWLAFHRDLLELRRREITPRLAHLRGQTAAWERLADRSLRVHWRLDDARLTMIANPSNLERRITPCHEVGRALYATHESVEAMLARGQLAPWSGVWFLSELAEHANER
jgi:maltooligosyltrehalose trehalohydrolase